VTTSICKAGSSATADCIDSAQPDGHKQNSKSAYVRVGHHAYDRSYVQYYVGHSAADSLPNATNASIEYTVTNGASSGCRRRRVVPCWCPTLLPGVIAAWDDWAATLPPAQVAATSTCS
jgi:hypothetical protein